MYNRLRLGEILMRANKLSSEDVDRVLRLQSEKEEGRFGEIAIEDELVKEEDVLGALAAQVDCGYAAEIPLDDVDILLLESLNLGFCRENMVLPIRREGHEP